MNLPFSVVHAARENQLEALAAAVAADAASLATGRTGEGAATLLHLCAQMRDPAAAGVARALIGAGAEVDARDFTLQGLTPLQAACSGGGNPRVAQVLLEAGADPNAQTITREDIARYKRTRELVCTGIAPLHFAFRADRDEQVDLLLRHGASPTLHTGHDGWGSPLHAARRKGRYARFLPVLRALPLDPPTALRLEYRFSSEDDDGFHVDPGVPPESLTVTYAFPDPGTEPDQEGSRERRQRLGFRPLETVLERAALSTEGVQLLAAALPVPAAEDGLPCDAQLDFHPPEHQTRAVAEAARLGECYSDPSWSTLHLSVVDLRKGERRSCPCAMIRGTRVHSGGGWAEQRYLFHLDVTGL